MEAINYFAQQSMKKNVPELRPGDTVRVHQRIREGNKERIQIFEGVVLSVRGGKSINSSFVVRRVASGVGVEKTFPLHSPNVVKIQRLKSSKVRQARLYYLRERFGRTARMTGEVRSSDSWDESTADEAEAGAEKVEETGDTDQIVSTDESDSEAEDAPTSDDSEEDTSNRDNDDITNPDKASA